MITGYIYTQNCNEFQLQPKQLSHNLTKIQVHQWQQYIMQSCMRLRHSVCVFGVKKIFGGHTHSVFSFSFFHNERSKAFVQWDTLAQSRGSDLTDLTSVRQPWRLRLDLHWGGMGYSLFFGGFPGVPPWTSGRDLSFIHVNRSPSYCLAVSHRQMSTARQWLSYSLSCQKIIVRS